MLIEIQTGQSTVLPFVQMCTRDTVCVRGGCSVADPAWTVGGGGGGADCRRSRPGEGAGGGHPGMGERCV